MSEFSIIGSDKIRDLVKILEHYLKDTEVGIGINGLCPSLSEHDIEHDIEVFGIAFEIGLIQNTTSAFHFPPLHL